MAVALIFAGGTGERMNSKTKPKQFLELHGRPILIHTIEKFENHPQITDIIVVCVEDWIDECYRQIKKNYILKVRKVVAGGKTGQQSIYNGLVALKELVSDNEIVLIHDGVRPLITDQLITDNINKVIQSGSAITVSYATETIISTKDDSVENIANRDVVRIAKAPQSFYYKNIMDAHIQAINDDLINFVDSASLMKHYNHELFIVMGSAYNIKITTPSDFYIFRAIYEAKENSQIFGL